MRKVLWLALALMLALTALANTPPALSADNEPPPQIIDSTPIRGEELAVDGSVTFYFDQAMDQGSVEAAFFTLPSVQGRLEWLDPAAVRFTPNAPLERATEYTFGLTETARSAANVPLRSEYTLRLQTVGFLEVAQIIPADNTRGIEAAPLITVIFNRPVVPLMSIDDMKRLPSPLTLEPAADGAGEWLSTSIYTFKPTQLIGGTTYTIRVKAGLTDVTGAVLTQDVTSTFSTVSPRAISVSPENDRVLLEREVTLTFSQPMDRASTEAAFALLGPRREAVPGTFTWNERSTILTFKPSVRYQYATRYTVLLDKNRAKSSTGATLSEGVESGFTTIPLPDLVNTWPNHDDRFARDSGISFRFSAPMDLKDFKKRVKITPEPKLLFDDYFDDQGFFYTIGFSHEPSTRYRVTLNVTNFKDIYGTPLKPNSDSSAYRVQNGQIVIEWETPDYFPEANLRVGWGPIGLYSAYSGPTRVYTTHRNVDALDFALYKVPLEDALAQVDGYQNRESQRRQNYPLLRSWSVKVENPKNVLRYDLIAITNKGGDTAPAGLNCPGVPYPRLTVGDSAIVLPDDPTPLNMRSEPRRSASVVARLPIRTRFQVRGGPVCRDNLIWWEIQPRGTEQFGWIAEGTREGYFVGPEGSTSRVERFIEARGTAKAYDPNAPALAPGVYLLKFSSPQTADRYSIRYHRMVVATANLTVKANNRQMLIWATDLKSGLPLPNVTLKVYGPTDELRENQLPKLLGEVITNADGLAEYTLPETPRIRSEHVAILLDDGTNYGLGSAGWADGISSWSFDIPSNYNPPEVTAYLYTDRSLYRPGQPIYLRGVIRNRNDMTYTLSDARNVLVEVRNAIDQIVYSKPADVTPFGSFSAQIDVDENAPLGYYQVTVYVGITDPKQIVEDTPRFVRGVSVAQYRVPEFQVKVEAAEKDVVQGSTITVNVESSYFFGGAVSNARVEWSAFTDNFFFDYKGKGRYNFVDFNEDEGFREGRERNGQVANGVGTTDANGRFTIELPASLGKAGRSQKFTIEARVIDESDQLIAGTVEVVVHQGEFYIGAGPERYVGTASTPQQINLVTVGWDSKPFPNTPVAVRVVERRWTSVQTVEQTSGRTVWNYDVQEIPVADGEVQTDADGKAIYTFTPDRGGVFKVYVTSRDSKGNQVTTSTYVWVAGPNYVPWRQQNSSRIDLKIDRDNYRVGDTASILIAHPFQGEAMALITVERGNILKREVVKLPNNSTVYQLPITPDLAPNAFVSVVIIKGVDANNVIPAFRMGLVQFGVDVERLKLNITVTPDKEQAGPRETVNYKIRVTDWQGEPVQAELGVGLTDLAVLSLLPDTSTPILQHFYAQQGLSIRTGLGLVYSVDRETQEILTTIKGGGGGGPEGGIFEVRQRFIDTPLWQPSVVTDQNGEAVVSVTLPDQLTTWRLDVRAATAPIGELQTTLVGQTTFDLISTKPLLVRPVTPRFYVRGDKSTLVAIVNNNSGADQAVTARVEVKGVTLLTDAEQTKTIPNRGRARFEWPIEVQDVSAVDVTFFAQSADGKFGDAAKSAVGQGEAKTLPVYKYEAPETVGTGGTLDTGGSLVEGISISPRYNATEGNVRIRLDRSLAASTVDALRALEYFPHQCTEQTISRFLPNVATLGAFAKLGLDDPALRANVDQAVSLALQRLYNDQKSDGGWGWFSRDRSDALVTAYALIGLTEARQSGFQISDNVTEAAIRFLQQQLNRESLGSRPSSFALNRQAFLNYALAYADAGNYTRLINLFDRREQMGVYGRAFLAMSFHLIDPNQRDYINALISDLNSRAIVSATGAHWEELTADRFNWNTDTRTTAIVLKALIQLDPTNGLIPNVVRWLMIARTADSWETTQETAWAVMALADWMQVTGELRPNYTFGALLNDTPLAIDVAATPESVRESVVLNVAVADLLKGLNRLKISRTEGEGVLYYTTHVTVNLPVEQIQPVDRGISISRTYHLATDPTKTPITSAKVGENVVVTLTIIAKSSLNYVVIEDPIPAGTEAVDPQLATSAIGQPPELELDDPLDRGWGWWWFSRTELRDEKTVLYATYLPAGTYRYTYTVRAGLAGEYRVMPSTGSEFYTPEVYGRGAGMIFTITPNPENDPTNPQN